MKKTLIISFIYCFLCGGLSFNVSGQEYKYDLNKYYTPDIVRRGLDLNFNTIGSLSNSQSQNTDRSASNDTVRTNSLNGNMSSKFFLSQSTRKKESLLQLNLNLAGAFDNNSNGTQGNSNYSKTHNSNSSEGISINFTNKLYNSSSKFFSFGILSSLSVSNSNNKDEVTNSVTKNTAKNFQSQIAPFVGIGIGRIESVKDARQAIYILDDLSKRGALTRHLSDDEIFKLSQVISQIKNKRFLDARLHKIDEVSTIDSFFVKNSLLTKSDATYFTTLYDNWENGANFDRKSGKVFEIKLSPFVNWNNGKTELEISNPDSSTWQKRNQRTYGSGLTFNYTYAKQVNLNWERTAYASLSGGAQGYQSKTSAQPITNYTDKQNMAYISLSGNYSIGYYPSSRTHLLAGLTQNFSQGFYDNISNNNWNNSFSSNSTLQFSAVYYVSPQLSLSGDVTIYDYYNKYTYSSENTHNNQIGGNFSASLKYSFF